MNYDYFYGCQADSYSFYRIPRILITGEEFRSLSTDAKLLYSLLLDRMSLSMRNGWLDKEGRVYIYYTLEEIQKDLCCGHVKAGKLLAELDTQKGIGLIDRKKQGQGKPTKIYVKQFVSPNIPSKPTPKDSSEGARHTEDVILESSEYEVRTDSKNTSGATNNVCADCRKADANYTDNNQTEKSYTDPSIYPSADSVCLEDVREQVDYLLLAESYPNDDPESLLEIICDVLCSTAPYIRLGDEKIPTPKVQERFRRLRFEHLAYVLDSLGGTTTKIQNIKAYLLRTLYDAPLTIGHFYSNAVRHDQNNSSHGETN